MVGIAPAWVAQVGAGGVGGASVDCPLHPVGGQTPFGSTGSSRAGAGSLYSAAAAPVPPRSCATATPSPAPHSPTTPPRFIHDRQDGHGRGGWPRPTQPKPRQ